MSAPVPVNSPMMELHNFKKGLNENGNGDDLRKDSTSTDSTVESCVGMTGAENEDEVFFDTIGVQFHFHTFSYQLAAHLCLPLFPFLINVVGQLNWTFYNVLGSWVAPILFYIMIVSYCMLPNDESTYAMHGAFLIPMVYFLQHRLVISIKYGTLSRTEYKKFMECMDRDLCCCYMNQIQLFQGWFDFNPLVVRFELAAASARIGARINEIDLLIDNPKESVSALNQLRAWNAFIRGHDVIDYDSKPCKQLRPMPDGSYALSVYDYCEALLMHSMKKRGETDVQCNRVTEFFSWVNLLIPLVLMAFFYPQTHGSDDAWLVLFYFTSTALNFLYAKLFYVLLYIAIVDVNRQKSIFTDLNSMIRLTDIMLYAELSGSKQKITEDELKNVEMRVAEIMSIRSSSANAKGKYTKCKFVSSDRDTIALGDGESPMSMVGGSLSTVGGVSARPTLSAQPSMSSSHSPVTSPAYHADGTAKSRGSVIGERIYKDNEYHMLPRINFDESHNIVAWTHARLVMQNFGERFHFRLELYVIAAMTMLIVMMALGLLNLGMAQDRIKLFCTPWFLQTLLSVTMCIGFLLLIMQTGACLNEMLEEHSQTMCSHSLRLNRKVEKVQLRMLAEKDEFTRAKLKERVIKLNGTIDKLDAMRGVIETNTELKPFKIFGFTAQSSLTMSILTTAVSFYGILVSLLSNTEGQAIQAVSGG